MRYPILLTTLLVSACATAPRTAEPALPPPQPIVRDPAGLVGLSAAEVIGKLGPPTLQIREGAGLKLQFRNSRCVIDTYLYASARGAPEKVEHVDTRAPSGVDANEQVCVDLFQSRAN
jgi:hypothetical protein